MAEFTDLEIPNENLMIKNEKVRQYLLNNYGIVMNQYASIYGEVSWFLKLDENGKTIEPIDYVIYDWKYPENIIKPDNVDALPLDRKQMRQYFKELERKKRRAMNKEKLLERLLKRLGVEEEDLLNDDEAEV
jgi:hypothetical protein